MPFPAPPKVGLDSTKELTSKVPAAATAKAAGKAAGAQGSPAGVPDEEEWGPPPWRRRLLVAAIFVVAMAAMVRRTPDQLSHRLLGNLSDPGVTIWALRWDGHALLHVVVNRPLSIFDANIYAPASHTLAYADDLISVSPIYNALYALTHNWVLSFNLLWLGELALNMGATYSLARWLTRRTEAAVFAGLAGGFSAFVWSQIGHPPLELLGLFPLGLLLLFKLLHRPRPGLGVGLGLVNLVILLSVPSWAGWYAVAAVVVGLGWLIAVRGRLTRGHVVALAAAAVITVAAVPTLIPYHQVHQQTGRQALAPMWNLRPGDLVRATAGSYLYPSLAPGDTPGTLERHLFPGFLTLALAGLGGLALILSYRRKPASDGGAPPAPAAADGRAPPPSDRRVFVVLLLAVGVVALVLAWGASPHGSWTPWRFFHDHVPGFAGLAVPARLAAFGLLALAVLAGVGLDAVLRLLPHAALRLAVAAVACVVVLAELAAPLPWVTLPSDRATLAVYHALSHRPNGVVLELPMTDPSLDSPRWAHTEPARMVWSSLDWHPRVNGYSGYRPAAYSDDARVLATLPQPAAQARLRQRHVRYLILHVGLQTGYPMFTDDQARALINQLGPGATSVRYGPNYLVDLGPG